MHHLPSLRNSFNACHVLSAAAGEKTSCFFSRQKNPRCSPGNGDWQLGQYRYWYHTGAGRSVFWSVFWALKNLAGTLKGLAGNLFFLKMGAGPLKMGALTPLSRKKGVPAKIIIPKCTDQVFLRYRFGKNQEIPTKYQPKKTNRYPTLDYIIKNAVSYKPSRVMYWKF